MIPKTIHYCWFGRNPKPKLAKKCIRSWKRHCKGYEIIEWNEDNYDISSAPLYVRQAYEAKKWAFVSDYVRLWVIYTHGGIYFDTDVEVLKPLDYFLQYKAFFGLESEKYVATGLGFGAEKGASILEKMMSDYYTIPFLMEDGAYDETACPKRNSHWFSEFGFQLDDTLRIINGICVCPSSFFNPKDGYNGQIIITEEAYSVHHFCASWANKETKKRWKAEEKHRRRERNRSRIRQRIRNAIGDDAYNRLKRLKK